MSARARGLFVVTLAVLLNTGALAQTDHPPFPIQIVGQEGATWWQDWQFWTALVSAMITALIAVAGFTWGVTNKFNKDRELERIKRLNQEQMAELALKDQRRAAARAFNAEMTGLERQIKHGIEIIRVLQTTKGDVELTTEAERTLRLLKFRHSEIYKVHIEKIGLLGTLGEGLAEVDQQLFAFETMAAVALWQVHQPDQFRAALKGLIGNLESMVKLIELLQEALRWIVQHGLPAPEHEPQGS